MAEPIIASAVALPEAEEAPLPSPKSSLKRRQSSVPTADNKRPRLSTDANAAVQDDASEPPPAASPTTPTERRKGGVAEERTRNKRMFGGLLGHLAQASLSSAQRRRADIEQKQQAKLKLQAEEREEEKRKKGEEMLVMRRREQRVYDRQAMRTRHDNLLNMAQFLKTKCEPVLFYKPWDLQSTDEDQIKSQIEEAQTTIDRELKELAIRAGSSDKPAKDGVPQKSTSEDQRVQEGSKEAPRNPDTVGSETNSNAKTASMQGDSTNSHSVPPSEIVHTHQESAKAHEDDHGGEVMVEDQEDTVIY